MILKNKRQVVIINDIRSDKIEQAILILRDKGDKNPYDKGYESDLLIEAHRIINGFMYPSRDAQKPSLRQKVAVQGLLWLLSAGVVVLSVVMLIRMIAPL